MMNAYNQEDSVKNHTEVLIFHTAICFWAKTNSMMADEKLHTQLSHRLFTTSRSEKRIL